MVARAFSPLMDQEIARRYLAGENVLPFAAEFGVSPNTIYASLRRAGVVIDRWGRVRARGRQRAADMRTLSDAEEAGLAAEYLAGESAPSIARRRGIRRDVVFRALSRQGVEGRAPQRKYSLDEGAFDRAEDCEAAAYWVGFLMADGSVYKHRDGRHFLKLALSADHAEHVAAFTSFLKTDCPVRIYPNGSGYASTRGIAQVQICSERLATALSRYGVIERKSTRERVLLLEGNPHFWRGMICGDGSIWVDRAGHPHVSLCGSHAVITQFLSFCRLHTSSRASPSRNGKIWQTSMFGSHGLAILRACYGDASVALESKWQTARAVLATYTARKRGGGRWLRRAPE